MSAGWMAEGVGWYGVAAGGGTSGGSMSAGEEACGHDWVARAETVTVVDESAWSEEVVYAVNHCNVCGENISQLDYSSVEEIKEMNDWIQSDEAQAMPVINRLKYVRDTWLSEWYDAVSDHSNRCDGNTSLWEQYAYLEHPAVTNTETKTVWTCTKCGAVK